MFCQKCGQQIPDNSVVCPVCGAPVGNSQAANQNQPNQPQMNQQVPPQPQMNQQVPPQPQMDQQVPPQQNYGYAAPQPKNNKTKIIIAAIIAVVVLAGATVGILFWTGVLGKNYVGKYELIKMSTSGKTFEKGKDGWKSLGDDPWTINLKDDGKMTMSFNSVMEGAMESKDIDSSVFDKELDYEVDGDKIIVKGKNGDNKGTLEDGELTFDFGGVDFTFKKDD